MHINQLAISKNNRKQTDQIIQIVNGLIEKWKRNEKEMEEPEIK